MRPLETTHSEEQQLALMSTSWCWRRSSLSEQLSPRKSFWTSCVPIEIWWQFPRFLFFTGLNLYWCPSWLSTNNLILSHQKQSSCTRRTVAGVSIRLRWTPSRYGKIFVPPILSFLELKALLASRARDRRVYLWWYWIAWPRYHDLVRKWSGWVSFWNARFGCLRECHDRLLNLDSQESCLCRRLRDFYSFREFPGKYLGASLGSNHC